MGILKRRSDIDGKIFSIDYRRHVWDFMSEKDKIMTFRRLDDESRIDIIIEILSIEEATEILAFWVNEEEGRRLFFRLPISTREKIRQYGERWIQRFYRWTSQGNVGYLQLQTQCFLFLWSKLLNWPVSLFKT